MVDNSDLNRNGGVEFTNLQLSKVPRRKFMCVVALVSISGEIVMNVSNRAGAIIFGHNELARIGEAVAIA